MAEQQAPPGPPDDKPWTPQEIFVAKMINAMEDVAESFNEFGKAYQDSVRREREQRAEREKRVRQRFETLRKALRDGTVR